MSEDGNEEYEVESILKARLEKQGRGRTRKLVWKYNVRWKGYTADDDTWEPTESFEGSEHFVEQFWERANTGGRDRHDVNLFRPGEEFFPVGPPRRNKRKRTSGISPATPAAKRRHTESPNKSPDCVDKDLPDASPTVLLNNSPPRRQSPLMMTSRNRDPSPEIPGTPQPPPSDEEDIDMASLFHDPDDKARRHLSFAVASESDSAQAISSTNPAVDSNETVEVVMLAEEQTTSPPQEPSQQESSRRSSSIPSHRARAANPLVKMVDDPQLLGLQNAISAKARAAARIPSASATSLPNSPTKSPRVSGSRAGPGRNSKGLKQNRSSLLTFDKGVLKTRKGTYNADEKREQAMSAGLNNDSLDLSSWDKSEIPGLDSEGAEPVSVNVRPPTSQDLLQLAGLDGLATADLDDFNDDASVPSELAYPHETTQMTAEQSDGSIPQQTKSIGAGMFSAVRQSIASAKEALFPSASSSIIADSVNKWRQSDANNTIFGPLAIGSGRPSSSTPNPSSATATKFYLGFGSSSFVPVSLLDDSCGTPGVSSLDEIIQIQSKGPPGQFYRDKFAHALLDTLRACGPSAEVVPIESEMDEGKQNDFSRFKSRLAGGELFVEMVGVELLVFCMSENSSLTQRLNFPKALLAEPGRVLVSRVVIENDLAYTDATENADSSRW